MFGNTPPMAPVILRLCKQASNILLSPSLSLLCPLFHPLEWLPPHFCQPNLNSTDFSKPSSDMCLKDLKLTNIPCDQSIPCSLALPSNVREVSQVTSPSLRYSAEDGNDHIVPA